MTEAIRIGVAVPDLSEFVAVDETFGIGDQEEQVEAVLERWRHDGRLPVRDHDVVPVYRRFRSADTDGKREIAARFALDDGVVAVVGARDFTYGAVRLATEFGVPVVDVNAVPTSLLARTAPWLFTLRAAQDVLYRSFVRWADREGHLTGRTIGVFSDRFTGESTAAAKDELARLGHEVAIHVASDGAGVASDRDEDAAVRFEAAGVDLVLPFVSGSSLIELLRHALERGYRPSVVDLETGEHATDVTAALLPAEIYDGTPALTMNRVGELPAGLDLTPETRQAFADFEAHTGRRIDPLDPTRSGETTNILLARDVATLVLEGLTNAEGPITRHSVARGLTSIEQLPMASGGDVTFGPGERWGIRQVRAIQWDADRGHWVARSDWEPLPVPAPAHR